MPIFESECKACQILKEALDFERRRNQELTETLTSLLKPQPTVEYQIPKELKPIAPARMTLSRRRLELEKADRASMEAKKSPYIAIPDKDIQKSKELEKLERELGVVDSDHEDKKGA